MNSDEAKLFVGGISWETSEEKLKDHFSKYGEVLQAVIMKDKVTSRPRGFGFVAFSEASVLDAVLRDEHVLDGRSVEAKRAMSREEQQASARSGHSFGRTTGVEAGGNPKTKKIFVGGLPSSLTEDEFRTYFESYGTVTDVVVMYDQSTHRPRGFGFISFDSDKAVNRVLHKTFHELNGKSVEVKRALPKDANSNSRSNGNASYGGSNANSNSYQGGADASRYTQPQSAGSYPGYGSSGYGDPGYGYGVPNGYGSYGMGSYGAVAVGYGGPTGAFVNPNPAAGAYLSGPRGAPRPWASQAPGYAPGGYGTAGYGPAAIWNAAASVGRVSVAASTAQHLSGSGHGNQGHGYGGAIQGGYGASGRQGGSEASSGNAPANATGQEPAYSNGYNNGNSDDPITWKSDLSQGVHGVPQANGSSGGGSAGYGAYGGTQPRQAQP